MYRPAALPKDMLWDVMTKQLEFEPDAATLEIVAKLAPGVPFRERELSSILTKFEVSKPLLLLPHLTLYRNLAVSKPNVY